MSDKLNDRLNYNLDKLEDRMKLVNDIVEENDESLVDYYDKHYNPHINQNGYLSESTKIGKELESLADYILYSKDVDATEDIITDYRDRRNTTREASIENVIKVKEAKKETNKSIMKVQKIKVDKSDREQHIELSETGKTIERLTKMIKTKVDSKGESVSPQNVRRYKWIRTDIQKDEIAMKTQLKGYITFQSIAKSEPDYNALSYIRFDDVEIIRLLIEYYAEFKENCYDDTFGYMKLIIYTLEELIDKTELEDYVKDVLIWKIEKFPYDEILNLLKDKYGLALTKPRLSKMTRETIPKMIVETYKQQREDWIYTYALKGKYKECTDCKQNYLATTKYFSPNKTSKSGLRPICKSCRKLKTSKKQSAKTVELSSSKTLLDCKGNKAK